MSFHMAVHNKTVVSFSRPSLVLWCTLSHRPRSQRVRGGDSQVLAAESWGPGRRTC